jgi:hypothetical protein
VWQAWEQHSVCFARTQDAAFFTDVLADRVVWQARMREPAQKGSYTVVLNPADDAASRKAPLGDGVTLGANPVFPPPAR